MTKLQILLLILIPAHLFFSVKAIQKVRRTNILSYRNKQLQVVLILAIPFLWSMIVQNIIKTTPGSHKSHKELPVNKTYFDEADMNAE